MLAALPFALAIGVSIYGGAVMKEQLVLRSTGLLEGFGLATEGLFGTLLGYLAALISFFAMAMLMPLVSTLAAVPFNDFLAEATEPVAEPPLPTAPTPNLGGRLALIWLDLVKTFVALGLTVVAVLIGFIPGAQIVSFPLVWLLFAFGVLTYPQTRRGERVGPSVRFLGRYLGACLGFGLVHTLLALLPLVGYLVPPLAVVGGTLLYAQAVGSGWRAEG
jgi:uncharacterized protein involved in cysteine biosynthesis